MIKEDQIEKYLMDQLSPTEKADFEIEMTKDPNIASEVDMHSSVIEGLQNYRHSQLKTRLNNLPTPTSTLPLNTIKIGAGMMALISGLLILTWNLTTEDPKITNPQLIEIPDQSELLIEETVEANILETEEKLDYLSNDNQQVTKNNSIPSEIASKENKSLVETNNISVKEEQDANPVFEIPTGVNEDNTNDQLINKGDNPSIPQSIVANTTEITKAKIGVETNKSIEKHKFHYKNYNNKLYLYGNFSESYEVLELKNDNSKDLYMYYQDEFYKINTDVFEPKELQTISDPSLIKKLSQLLN